MRREQLEHVLRAAATITGAPDVLVIGSQSILGAIPEQRLPFEATASIEVDVTFFDDPRDVKSDQGPTTALSRNLSPAGKRTTRSPVRF